VLHHDVNYVVPLSEVEWPDRRLGVSGHRRSGHDPDGALRQG
jgi:hypothetical protein